MIEKKTVNSPKGEITIYKITNNSGASIELSSLGAGLLSVVVPDKNGKLDDVVIGYANPCDYLNDGPCAGKVPGRYANRIAKGHLKIGDKTYQLAINNGPNALHGGPEGFQNQIWKSEVKDGKVVFSYFSKNGEESYPGNLIANASYSWSENNELTLEFKAVSDENTAINLTNHTYFNLKGENVGNALDHVLKLACSKYLPTDDTLIPTGDFASVVGTPMDFTSPKKLGKDIKGDFPALNYGKGYDNCWVVDDYDGTLKEVAILEEPNSGRAVHISTTQPAAQVYTGNWLTGSPKGKSGRDYQDYDGVAIECQGMPDAPNNPNFPSQFLYPGDIYSHIIKFAFKTI